MTYTSSAGSWSCDAATPDASGQQVTCVLDGTDGLLAGTDAPPLHLTVQTDAALDPGVLTNTATVDSPTTDPSARQQHRHRRRRHRHQREPVDREVPHPGRPGSVTR